MPQVLCESNIKLPILVDVRGGKLNAVKRLGSTPHHFAGNQMLRRALNMTRWR